MIAIEQRWHIQTSGSTSEYLYFILHLPYIIRQVTSVGFRACVRNLFVQHLPGERISPATTASLCTLSQAPVENNLMWLVSWLFSHLSITGNCSHVLWYTNSGIPLAGRTRILVFGLSYLDLLKKRNHVSESSASIEYSVQPTSFLSTKHAHSFHGHSQWTRHWTSSSASISTSLLITTLLELLYER